MLKKMTMFLILILIVSTINYQSIKAEENIDEPVIYVNDNFDQFIEGNPTGWSLYGGSDQAFVRGIEIDEMEGRSLEFTLNEQKDPLTLRKILSNSISGNIILETKVKFDRTDFYSPFFEIESSNGKRSALLLFGTDGKIKVGNHNAGTYEKDQWYHAVIALDLDNEKLDFYLNGDKIITDGKFDNSDIINDIKSFKIYSKSQADKTLKMHIDDIRVYSGETPADDDIFNKDDGDVVIPPDENIYDPSAEQIITDLKENNPDLNHPRLFAKDNDFARIKSQILTDPYIGKWYKDLRKSADKILNEPVGKYETPDGRRMPSAKTARPRIETTALMYQLSGEEKYADRALTEMLTVSNFPDWNHQNEFLNTAEMTAGVAIGYDWLYDYMSEDERELVRTAIKEKGLKKALEAHANNAWWVNRVEGDKISNWNAVSNGGIIMGALAIGDEEEEVSGAIIAKSLRSLEDYILKEFNPDGGWSEGPGYWRYTIEYMVSYMAALESAVGTTYGHAEEEGLYKTAYFPLYITGAQGSFNFADSNSNKMKVPELFWLAKQADDPFISGQRLLLMEEAKQAGGVYDILWYDSDFYDLTAKLDLDKYFSRTEVATFRSSWNDPYAAFAGILAGTGDASHAHSDVGNFVFEANGEQWAIDLGSEDYGLPGYFSYDKERYTYYRLKPEGHNTIVINPDAGFQQEYTSFNKIDKFVSKPKGGFAITDMTKAYAKNVTETKRGLMLNNNRQNLIIQDEIRAKAPSDIWWFMHTKADINVAEDGKTAILTLNGKKMWATIVSPDDELNEATFQVMAAKPLETSLNPAGQNPNNGIRKLAIELNDVQNVNLAVVLVPLNYGEEEPSNIPEYVPLEEWSIADGEIDIPIADAITIDDKLIEGFDSNQFYYDIKLPFGTTKIPFISASSKDEIEIIQAEGILKPAQVIVTDQNDPTIKTTYTIQYSILSSLERPENVTKLDISDVIASDEQDGNPAINSIDGDYTTRWSAEGAQWIQYDLGSTKKISTVGIALSNGHTRSSVFEFEVSDDGENWEKVYIGASMGTTEDMEYYGFVEQNARYLRILGNGNTSNAWNSYNEVEIYGTISNEAPVIEASDRTITVGDAFDPSVGIKASDEEDGDLTSLIEIVKNEVDTRGAGVYEVTYKVTDSDGNTVTKTITVTVKEVSESVSNEAPVLEASDQTIIVGDAFDPILGVKASDEEDGDLTSSIKIIKNEVDTKIVGDYEVTYEVTDSDGNTVTKTITVTVEEKSNHGSGIVDETDLDKTETEDDTGQVDIKNDTDQSEDLNDDHKDKTGDKLPSTATKIYTWLLLGVILIGMAGVLTLYRKKAYK